MDPSKIAGVRMKGDEEMEDPVVAADVDPPSSRQTSGSIPKDASAAAFANAELIHAVDEKASDDDEAVDPSGPPPVVAGSDIANEGGIDSDKHSTLDGSDKPITSEEEAAPRSDSPPSPAATGADRPVINGEDEATGEMEIPVGGGGGVVLDPPDERSLWAAGFRQAAWHLENNRGASVRELHMSRYAREYEPGIGYELVPAAAHEDNPENEMKYPVPVRRALFVRFVQELESGACDFRDLTVQGVDWRGLAEPDLRHLFGTVLPSHRTLRTIDFDGSSVFDGEGQVPTQWLNLLFSSIHSKSNASRLEYVGLVEVEFGVGTAKRIADMIRRDPPHLTTLFVRPTEGLETEECRLICQAVSHNTSLRHLDLGVEECVSDMLIGALGPTSPLKKLVVNSDEKFTDDFAAGIAAQLRTNPKLEALWLQRSGEWGPVRRSDPLLDLGGYNDDDQFDAAEDAYGKAVSAANHVFQPLLDALKEQNFNLFELEIDVWNNEGWMNQEKSKILSRNRRLHRAFKEFGVTPPAPAGPSADGSMPMSFRVETPGMWPSVLEVSSGIAAPLYRFLRRGALKDVCDHIQETHMPGTQKRVRDVDDVAPRRVRGKRHP